MTLPLASPSSMQIRLYRAGVSVGVPGENGFSYGPGEAGALDAGQLPFEILADHRMGGRGDLGEHHPDFFRARVVNPLVDVRDAALDLEDDVLADRKDEVEGMRLLEALGVLGEEE